MIAKHNRPNTNSLAVPVDSAKEPAGRQKSSGLAHLMSALHQNAAAVVNSKTQLNGPDQVRKVKSFFLHIVFQKCEKSSFKIASKVKNQRNFF